jgi:hypothetical protein
MERYQARMPAPFQDLDARDFSLLLARFPFERRITGIHLHHTGQPRGKDWRGYETLRTIAYTHTLQNGWSDMAQHLTIDPTGTVWTGRDWNRPPCSCPNRNGDRRAGPFMVVLIGDFTRGRETIPAAQYERAIDVIARTLQRFQLGNDCLEFHRDLDPTPTRTCPGDSIRREDVLADVDRQRAAIAGESASETPRPETPPFGEDAEVWYQFICISNGARDLVDEPPDVPRAIVETLLGESDLARRKSA